MSTDRRGKSRTKKLIRGAALECEARFGVHERHDLYEQVGLLEKQVLTVR